MNFSANEPFITSQINSLDQSEVWFRTFDFSSLTFLHDFFGNGDFPENLFSFLSRQNFEETRLFFLFLSDSWRWSVTSSPTRFCSLCTHSSLTSRHFFECSSLPTYLWYSDLVETAKRNAWERVLEILLEILRFWSDNSRIVRVPIRQAVRNYCVVKSESSS